MDDTITMKQAYKVLQDCLSAIHTMEDDSLGRDHVHGFYYKDELISNILEAQQELAEHLYYKDVQELDERDSFGHLA